MNKCPHCGSIKGYYKRVYMKGRSEYYYNFDGTEATNYELHSGMEYRENKSCFCATCDKKIKII